MEELKDLLLYIMEQQTRHITEDDYEYPQKYYESADRFINKILGIEIDTSNTEEYFWDDLYNDSHMSKTEAKVNRYKQECGVDIEGF